MNTRKDRLNEVYEHLRNHFGIHTKTQFAAVLKITQPALSSAMNGNEAYLTDNLFKKICAAYQGVFNLDYLLTGNGQLLTLPENKKDVTRILDSRNDTRQFDIDISSVFNSALAAKDDAIESLKREIQSLHERIADKEEIIADKLQIISEQKARLIEYRRIIDSKNDIESYSFPVGAADQTKSRKRIK